MYIPQNKNFYRVRSFIVLLLCLSINTISLISIKAEDLQSTNFEIKNAGISNSQGTLDSSSLSLEGSIGNLNDARLTSGTYAINSNSGTNLLNVPKVQCFETNSTNNDTSCLSLPNNNGMQGECGGFGCYSKAKIEIDSQGNPYDTLYLVKILDVTDNITYYLKSDHTLSLTYTISNYLSKCAIEGKDLDNPDCNEVGDSGWNLNLQSANIFYLDSNKTYSASVKALNGDYTETTYSNSLNSNTTSQAIALDLDIGPDTNPDIESSAPYNINIMPGTGYQAVQTSTDLLWFNFNTNNPNGFDFYIKDKYNGLYSQIKNVTIPSVSTDLSTDNEAGYGIKIYNGNSTQTSLGPLLGSIGYNTSGENEVGSLTTANKLLFSTNTSESGKGEIYNGRGAIIFKVKTKVTTPISSDYTDEVYFTIIGNY